MRLLNSLVFDFWEWMDNLMRLINNLEWDSCMRFQNVTLVNERTAAWDWSTVWNVNLVKKKVLARDCTQYCIWQSHKVDQQLEYDFSEWKDSRMKSIHYYNNYCNLTAVIKEDLNSWDSGFIEWKDSSRKRLINRKGRWLFVK